MMKNVMSKASHLSKECNLSTTDGTLRGKMVKRRRVKIDTRGSINYRRVTRYVTDSSVYGTATFVWRNFSDA